MDFDDLDDAIEEAAAQAEEGGELSGGLALMLEVSKKPKKVYEPSRFIPYVGKSFRAPSLEMIPPEMGGGRKDGERKICLRALLFYGAGDVVPALQDVLAGAPPWLELAAHEWPGHGTRGEEGACADLDALVQDAWKAFAPSFEDWQEGRPFDGAPFALIGHSIGAQELVRFARLMKKEMKLEPAFVVVLDRAPPDVPLFSEYGQSLLRSSPRDAVKDYRNEAEKRAAAGDERLLQMLLQDLPLGCETNEVGFHRFNCDVLVLRAKENVKINEDAKAGAKYRECTFKIEGTSETLVLPVTSSMKAKDLKEALAQIFGGKAREMAFLAAAGGEEVADGQEVGGAVTIRGGLGSFKNTRYPWPHPVGIIGCGYNGVKTGMQYMRQGNDNFVIFDRAAVPGGYCWITAANKHSKIQTEFGSFHIWWGPNYAAGGYGGCWGGPEDTWMKKARVLEHMRVACEEYGVLPNIRFQTNVAKLDVVGGKDKHERYYKLRVESLAKGGKPFDAQCSVLFSYPGSMQKNRIIEYPGEEEFDGQIGYGMNDDYVYDDARMVKARIAILGNGAFAVENVRSCVEGGANKVYLLTRRKNLASPRVPCWFCHQGPIPTPGRLVINMFKPMYELAGMGDPWDYWSVHANKERTNVTIIQNSRFGIGDVTFLACVYGKCEFVEDTLKRLTRHTLHLTGGRKLANVTVLNKSLGLLGDYAVDRLHGMQKMAGAFCEGDWRRVLMIDATGMNAANFTTFSTGIGTTGFVRMYKYFHDFPKEFYRLQGMGLMDQLPVNKANPKEDKPAYVTDVKMAMSASIIIESMCPKIGTLGASDPDYKYRMYHNCHPLQKTLDECTASWDAYQAEWKKNGSTHDYVPYPYTKEMMEGYFQEYSAHVGFPVSPYGPPEGSQAPELPGHTDLSAIPAWATDASAVGQAEMQAQGGNLSWWEGSAPWCEVNKGKKKTHAGH